MKVSYSWLKDFVDIDYPPEEIASKLTLSGSEVETIDVMGSDLKNMVVGQVKKIDSHPEAEKLKICKVDVEKEVLQIVCGASNVKIKAKVPVALIGAKLSDGKEIEKANLKGIDSSGMICSEAELGLGEDSQGIMILDDELRVGENLSSALDLEDFIFNLDLTPNRPDCLSILGVAREISALFGLPLKKPVPVVEEVEILASSQIKVKIDEVSFCPRYTCRIIRDVKVGPSPFWIRRRLQSCGIRSINNVVDATNYVMLELGHPLHAFDYDLFSQGEVVVRKAYQKEKFVTLDGTERELDPEILLITDGQRPVAVAGIMGGFESEVKEKTKNILLESAYFDPGIIRRGRIKLGITSESSHRFERGADPNNVDFACNRAVELIHKIAGGELLKGLVDNYPKKIQVKKIDLRPKRVNQILGTELSSSEISQILKSLEFKLEGDKDLKVEVPTFRPDVTREIDLIEEVARIYGYDRIETRMCASGNLVTTLPREEKFLIRVKEILKGLGLYEVVTNDLVDPEMMQKIFPEKKLVKIQNPLSPDLSVLRTSLFFDLLLVVSYNKKRKEDQVKIFEIGKVFKDRVEELPEEKYKIGVALSGAQEVFFRNKKMDLEFFYIKGILESFFESLSIDSFILIPNTYPSFSKGRSFDIKVEKQKIGFLGEANENILGDFDIKDKVFLCEIDFDSLLSRLPDKRSYQALPKFPPVDRDIAIVVNDNILAFDVEKLIKKTGGEILEKVTLFDLYRGAQIPLGEKSLAYSLRYRSKEKTLTDEDVNKIHSEIIKILKKEFGANLRS